MEPALKVAIDLVHLPSRVRQIRNEPLPAQMITVLRIAAGERDAVEAAATALDRPVRIIEDAASFFIEQVLFSDEADSYRVLGCDRTASTGDLRRNMALLLRWVHPDLDRTNARASFAMRVARAWDDLKTPERRAAYDQDRALDRRDQKVRSARQKLGRQQRMPTGPLAPPSSIHAVGRHHRIPSQPAPIGTAAGGGFLRRTLAFLFQRG